MHPHRFTGCVHPDGRFVFGLHRPSYRAANLREGDHIETLGRTGDGRPFLNHANFPADDVAAIQADGVFEIANPFPFRGATYIGKAWADKTAQDPRRIAIDAVPRNSLSQSLRDALGATAGPDQISRVISHLPQALKLAAATTSSDPADLMALAEASCEFVRNERAGEPTGLRYQIDPNGCERPVITDARLFDAVANNPWLPDAYKTVMVLRPGAQGQSEIVGDFSSPATHVFEYLRCNSYIPWGHYAANMAHDAIRYDAADLSPADVRGLRHLYYQRTYARLAEALGIAGPARRKGLSPTQLESLRRSVLAAASRAPDLPFTATLWGWNYGFDYAPSGYRLHASHQQIHQQFALIPETVASAQDPEIALPAYACGDMIQDFIGRYRSGTGKDFFTCYRAAIAGNQRMDGRNEAPRSLVIYQDEQIMLFVPKAQTSQWEIQLMALRPAGHILEADEAMRAALDHGLFTALRILTALGATMITVFESSRRFTITDHNQPLLYTFLPRLPESPGAFSEAQLRWINGHYPEDFAQACRLKMEKTRSEPSS